MGDSVKRGPQNKKMKAMVAIDHGEGSWHALGWTLQNFLKDIMDPISIYLHLASCGCGSTELKKVIQENLKIEAASRMKKAQRLWSEYGITAETMTQVGDPKELICETVAKSNIDLLVVGSHNQNHGCFKKNSLGSVSNYCVGNAKCNVLVVPV